MLIGKFILSSEEEILRAEILWALKSTLSNYSFRSNEDTSAIFQQMFPDSKIASSYKMSETKAKYVVEHGIKPYVLKELLNDFNGQPFTFKFDETTTSQVKKQYDGYIQYYSPKFQKIVNHYCGSLFLGHCTAENLKDHFYEFGEMLKWDVNLLMHLGMDGPNVNLLFQKKLEADLSEKYNKTFLNVGTCSIHPVHTAFEKGLKKITFDFNKFAQDLHFFFKYSSCRREDFKLASLETDLEVQFMIRHVSSRWLSLKKVLIRILDQWNNLKEYFLKILPKQKNFAREIEKTERYQSIRASLSNKITCLNMAFVIYVADILEQFIIPFQSSEPLIHLLYKGVGELLYKLMSNFMKKSLIVNDENVCNTYKLFEHFFNFIFVFTDKVGSTRVREN